MAKTYRITIEYTTLNDPKYGPHHWDWPELLNPDIARETFGVWVDDAPLNEDHVREIRANNQEMLQA